MYAFLKIHPTGARMRHNFTLSDSSQMSSLEYVFLKRDYGASKGRSYRLKEMSGIAECKAEIIIRVMKARPYVSVLFMDDRPRPLITLVRLYNYLFRLN